MLSSRALLERRIALFCSPFGWEQLTAPAYEWLHGKLDAVGFFMRDLAVDLLWLPTNPLANGISVPFYLMAVYNTA